MHSLLQEGHLPRMQHVIRGLKNLDHEQVINKFKDISSFLINKKLHITPVCIHRERGIYRATISHDSDKRELLSNTNKMKNSSFNNIFIHRDLIYNQRQELYHRRNTNNPTTQHAQLHPPSTNPLQYSQLPQPTLPQGSPIPSPSFTPAPESN